VWHASIARVNPMGPVVTSLWGDGMLRDARHRLFCVLAGVGRGETVELIRDLAVHHRRSLTPEEMATLSPEWLAIPAVDGFAPGGAHVRTAP
jgi:hypothetical protein